ncbi:hypothetical protein Q9L58_006350 [Maublancomyces gigas]|uniref:Uncharacterized protein n=1 Tax=Discina gigas TaxID=1032678 RepID=A0ABR3GFD1_9PEZI
MNSSSTLSSSNAQSSAGLNQPGVITGGRQVLSSGANAGSAPALAGTASSAAQNGRHTNTRLSNVNSGITPGATSQITPVKDQDGKFPCPHCPKTYLHAKHLKRHLLRHTGDRPYQCVLCKDTFSRSDILKRHFQKCSIRRGNPTGATHLSHAHAHQQGKQGNGQSTDTSGVSTVPSVSATGVGGLSPSQGSPGAGKKKSTRACDQCVRLKVRCDLASPCERCQTKGVECTYSRSVKRQDSRDEGILPQVTFQDQARGVGYGEEFNFPPPTHPAAMAHQAHQQQQTLVVSQQRQSQPSNPHQPPRPINTVCQPSGTTFYPPPPTGGEVDWTSFMQVGGEANFMDPFYLPQAGVPSTDSGTPTTTASMDHPDGGGVFGTLYSGSSDPSAMTGILDGFNGWAHLAMHQIDPLQAKCDQLIAICFPEDRNSPGNSSPNQPVKQEPGAEADLKRWLTPDSVKHFVHLFFVNFQGHFPMIHIPTFNITLIYDGLLLAIICIGAVYSKRGITVDQVRMLIDKCFAAIDRNGAPPGPLEIEEIQGRYFLHVLATWHGHYYQRESSRRRYGKLIQKARAAGLFQPLTPENPGVSGFSIYHQVEDRAPTQQSWSWSAWLEQEKRSRVMFGIFLLSSAFVIFFNSPPQIQLHEIRLPLPADDAAWEATDANECANALGLNGEACIGGNVAGSRQVRQPEFIVALKSLLQMHLDFKPGTTNAYSKFILIHALHVHIWTTQKLMVNASESGVGQAVGVVPQPMIDWETENQNRSDRGTPEGFRDGEVALSEAAKALRVTLYALEKWKRAWDIDLIAQYPSPTARVGFGRDGLPFCWLAKLYMARNRTLDWKHGVDDDQTVAKVKNMLRHLQGFVTDGTGRLDVQGAVCAIDDDFAINELTYDMKLLFRPIEEIDRSPPQQQAREIVGSWKG